MHAPISVANTSQMSDTGVSSTTTFSCAVTAKCLMSERQEVRWWLIHSFRSLSSVFSTFSHILHIWVSHFLHFNPFLNIGDYSWEHGSQWIYHIMSWNPFPERIWFTHERWRNHLNTAPSVWTLFRAVLWFHCTALLRWRAADVEQNSTFHVANGGLKLAELISLRLTKS